nr:MAG TPA: 15 kDa core protein [Caudoviricetes sp.]
MLHDASLEMRGALLCLVYLSAFDISLWVCSTCGFRI